MRVRGVAVALGAVLAALAAGSGHAQTLIVDLHGANPYRVAVSVRDLLLRRAFLEALQSGFPLYMEYRVSLRRPQAIRDRTVWDEIWELVVVYDPVRDRYTVRTPDGSQAGLDETRLSLRLAQVTVLPFDGPPGSYYFEAAVDARMLSDDDVDEAFAWLRGEAPDSGGLQDPGLLARVARRMLMRVTALPRLRLEGRTRRFIVP
jgi:hypothetical protein